MADIHGVPSESMMVPEQSFTSAPLPDVTAEFDGASALTGAGVLYPQGPRQAETERLLDSPPGYGAFNVISGFPDYESADITPPAQPGYTGSGGYPGTTQDGVPTYGA